MAGVICVTCRTPSSPNGRGNGIDKVAHLPDRSSNIRHREHKRLLISITINS